MDWLTGWYRGSTYSGPLSMKQLTASAATCLAAIARPLLSFTRVLLERWRCGTPTIEAWNSGKLRLVKIGEVPEKLKADRKTKTESIEIKLRRNRLLDRAAPCGVAPQLRVSTRVAASATDGILARTVVAHRLLGGRNPNAGPSVFLESGTNTAHVVSIRKAVALRLTASAALPRATCRCAGANRATGGASGSLIDLNHGPFLVTFASKALAESGITARATMALRPCG